MKTIKETARIYYRAALKNKMWLLLDIALVIIAVIAGSIVQPYIISKGINALPGFLSSNGNFWHTFHIYLFGIIVVEFVGWLAWRLSGLAYVKFEIPVLRDLTQTVYDHLMNMSNRFFSNTFSGSLVTQTNRFVNGFENIYDTLIFDVMQLSIKFVFANIILFTFAPMVSIGLILWSVVFIATAVWLSVKKLPLSKKAAERQSKTTARLADSLTNILNIKYFAREKHESKQFAVINQKQATAMTWDWGIQEVINAWQSLLMVVFEIGAFWISLQMVANHTINLGQLFLIQAYVGSVFFSLWQVSRIVRKFETSFANSFEMTEVLMTKPEIADPLEPLTCKIKSGEIVFEHVQFDHKDAQNDDPLFNGLTFRIAPGERVGLAGPSGGGKTTLTKLLLRMSDIDSGIIKIDGQDISKLKQRDLRSCITYVPQEPILFHRSLHENIRYGKPTASFEEVKQAAIKAHADNFINKLPNGYETLVGERGVKLSGGQRQRVAIARAILKDAPILVLDEATSALDSESEKLIQDALWQLMQGRTAIVVAHRLSTIQRLDRIVVIGDGNIVEDGSHSELISKKGLYAKLWAHQSGGFLKD